MGFLTDIQTGRCGLRFAPRGRFQVIEESAESATLKEAASEAALMLLRSDCQLELRPEHHAQLVSDAEIHTRDLFNTFFRSIQRPAESSVRRPRTDDPAWSPLVSIEQVRVAGVDALTVVHRMSYEMGHEVIMGHLLVPVRTGMIEFRIIARARLTGERESILFAQAQGNSDEHPAETMKRLGGQRYFDDPRYDSLFPHHPLSQIRAMLGALLAPGVIQVIDPAPSRPAGELVLPEVGGAMVPPPRYARMSAPGEKFVVFSRVSFSGTDGVQRLVISRLRDTVLPQWSGLEYLAMLAQELVKEGLPPGSTDVIAEARGLLDAGLYAQAIAHLEYSTGTVGVPQQQRALRIFAEENGHPVVLLIGAPTCVPREDLFQETRAIVDSWRPL